LAEQSAGAAYEMGRFMWQMEQDRKAMADAANRYLPNGVSPSDVAYHFGGIDAVDVGRSLKNGYGMVIESLRGTDYAVFSKGSFDFEKHADGNMTPSDPSAYFMTVSIWNAANGIHLEASHNRIGFVPLDLGENYGAFQMANYRAEIRVNGNQNQNQISVFAGSSNTRVADGEVKFSASASISVNNKIVETKYLNNGYANFNIPASGNVTLRVDGGWNVFYEYGGAAVPVFHPVFFPVTLNFSDTFNIK